MSCTTSNEDSPKSFSDNDDWVVHICNELDHLETSELKYQNSNPVCICEVPESLYGENREAIIPQFVGLGPYHHSRNELIVKEKDKLGAAKRVLKDLHDKDLFKKRISNFGSNLADFYHPDVRSAYHEFTLSYMLTLDTLFLLGFIKLLNGPNPDVGFSYFLTGNLGVPRFNAAGVELTKNALIREVFKLENQIPFAVLKQIGVVNDSEIQSDSDGLGSELERFCKQHCPLAASDSEQHEMTPTRSILETYHHFLDLMYHLIVPQPLEIDSATDVNQSTDPNQTNPTSNATDNQSGAPTNPTEHATGDNQSEAPTNPTEHATDDNQSGAPTNPTEHATDNQSEAPTNSTDNQSGAPTHATDDNQSGIQIHQVTNRSSDSSHNGFCFICGKFFGVVVLLILILGLILWLIIYKLVPWLIRSVFGVVKRTCCYLYGLLLKALSLLHGPLLKLAQLSNPTLRNIQSALPEVRNKFPGLPQFLPDLVDYLVTITDIQNSLGSDDVRQSVLIPSVKELHQAGIKFQPAPASPKSGIPIDFDIKTCTFKLPRMKLDTNSEVIIRNLVAYETLIKSSSPLIVTRFVELMRAVVDTPEDVKILVANGIIETELKNEVVTDLFNGMSKSIKPTNTKQLDQVIKDVNDNFYSLEKQNRAKSKYTSGTFLGAVAGLLFLAFTGVQTYCTVHNCSGSPKFGKQLLDDGDYYYDTSNHFISSM